MRIWPIEFTIKLDRGTGRSPGRHVSEVIRDLALRGKILDKKYATEDLDAAPERVALGLAWEEWIHNQHPEICFHPGEIELDGISMSVDGISYPGDNERSIFGCDSAGAVHEFKLTWKSSRKPIDEEWMWLTQLKAYCKGMTAVTKQDHSTGFLHVFYVNGNYSRNPEDPDGRPRYKVWGLEFTKNELRENWAMITNHSRRMGEKK
jgi:hypothetical protein